MLYNSFHVTLNSSLPFYNIYKKKIYKKKKMCVKLHRIILKLEKGRMDLI